MKSVMTAFLAIGLMAMAASTARASSLYITHCLRFARADGSNPYPTDHIVVRKLAGLDEHTVNATWTICVANPNPDNKPSCTGGHYDTIPMVGTFQDDVKGNKSLMLDGRIWDTALGSPFIHECAIADTLDPWTQNSLGCTGGHWPTCTGSEGAVYAYCEDYFDPDSPTGSTPAYLVTVPCP
jgi:hypothetical protein